MDSLTLEETEVTPFVRLDKEEGHFEISGRSYPENVIAFYGPVMKWMEGYRSSPNPETRFILKLDYLNTASSKLILDLLFKLEDIRESGRKVTVAWYYNEDDEDMYDAGTEYADVVDVPIEHIAM